MARLRQLYPSNYRSSGNVNAEMESIIRYLVAAERGNKTLAELMRIIFDEDGEFAPPIAFRVDAEYGLQYRIGEYEDGEEGWETISEIDVLRGPSGVDIGLVESPFFYQREDLAAADGQTVFNYLFSDVNMDVLVFKNGVLQNPTQYVKDEDLGTITLTVGFSGAGVLTVGAIRDAVATGFARSDLTAAENQAVFPFEFAEEDTLLIYKNGILQRFGGSYDYVTSFNTQTITFMSPLTAGELVTIMKAQDNSLRRLLGIMTEDKWTDGTGFIPYSKLKITDGELPQAKVSNLVSNLSGKIRVYVSLTEPESPENPSLWIQVTPSSSILWFYDGSKYVRTTPLATLPDFDEVDAGLFLAVNTGGTGFELTDVDFSALVPKSYMGAANGVASLTSDGKVPEEQVPDIYTIQSLSRFVDGAIANATYNISLIYRQIIKIDGISARVSAGTCKIQLAVGGVAVGPVLDLTTSVLNHNLGDVLQIDSSSEGKRLSVIVTNNAAASNLEIGLSAVSKNA